jgi:hypothetical protein
VSDRSGGGAGPDSECDFSSLRDGVSGGGGAGTSVASGVGGDIGGVIGCTSVTIFCATMLVGLVEALD